MVSVIHSSWMNCCSWFGYSQFWSNHSGLNEWLLLIELWFGLERSSWTITTGPQWSAVCWKTLTQSESDDADWSQSNPIHPTAFLILSILLFIKIQTYIWIYLNPLNDAKKKHLNILCWTLYPVRRPIWKSRASKMIPRNEIVIRVLLSKLWLQMSFFVQQTFWSISIAVGTFLQAVCFLWAG